MPQWRVHLLTAIRFISIASGEDTCDVTPSQRWVTLPPYCGTQDATGVESRHVDLGQCQPDVCRFRNQTANQGPSHCCGPIRSRTQQVTCRGFSYNLVKIEQCGCVACHLGHTKMMRGTVQIRDKSGTRPFSGALYVFEGTAYLTDNATGSFQLEVPQDAQRIVLRFPATSALYLPQVKVLHLDIPGNHFEHEVILQNQHHVVDFNPSLNKVSHSTWGPIFRKQFFLKINVCLSNIIEVDRSCTFYRCTYITSHIYI